MDWYIKITFSYIILQIQTKKFFANILFNSKTEAKNFDFTTF